MIFSVFYKADMGNTLSRRGPDCRKIISLAGRSKNYLGMEISKNAEHTASQNTLEDYKVRLLYQISKALINIVLKMLKLITN